MLRTAWLASMVGLLGSLALPASAAERCPPIAVVKGAGAPADELTTTLIARGIRVEPAGLPPGTCAVLHAEVTATIDGYTVWIGDSWGRTAERKVRDVLTAVTLVESWARMDLLVAPQTSTVTPPIAAAPAVEAAPAAAPLPTESASAPVAVTAPATPPDLERSSFSIHAAAEGSLSLDRTRWIGASVTACGRLGAFCLGATGRYAISAARQSAAEGLATLRLPMPVGRLTITPHVGGGLGWIGNERRDGPGIPRNALGPAAEEPDIDFDRDELGARDGRGGFGPRAEAGVDLAFRLSDSLHLQAGATAATAPRFSRRFELDSHLSQLRAHVGLAWGTP